MVNRQGIETAIKAAGKKMLAWVGVLLFLQTAYTFLMTAVYMLPSQPIRKNIQASIPRFSLEANYYKPFINSQSMQLAGNMDSKMLQTALASVEGNPLKTAMSGTMKYGSGTHWQQWRHATELNIPGTGSLARYWHGYMLYLRPLLLFFDYEGIRVVSSFVFFLLYTAAVCLLAKKTGWIYAMGLAGSMVFVKMYILPMSLPFAGVFNLMFIAILAVLLLAGKQPLNGAKMACLFLTIGSLTSFIDLLTTPLITLGVPLLVLLIVYNKQEETSLATSFRMSLRISGLWFAGYGLTWVSKWIIGSIVLKRNVIQDAVAAILFRTQGNDVYPVDRYRALRLNLHHLLSSDELAVALWVLLSGLAIFVLLRRRCGPMRKHLVFLWVALYPYIWYSFLANHSQIHNWFTYRAQLVSLMGGFAFLAGVAQSNLETRRRHHERNHLEKVHSSNEMPLPAPPR